MKAETVNGGHLEFLRDVAGMGVAGAFGGQRTLVLLDLVNLLDHFLAGGQVLHVFDQHDAPQLVVLLAPLRQVVHDFAPVVIL